MKSGARGGRDMKTGVHVSLCALCAFIFQSGQCHTGMGRENKIFTEWVVSLLLFYLGDNLDFIYKSKKGQNILAVPAVSKS